MSSIIFKTIDGKKYAYESNSYWDKAKKAPRTKRTYLGKVDPETGEIIRVHKKSEQTDIENVDSKDKQLVKLEIEAEKLREENQQLREQNEAMKAKLLALEEMIESIP